MRRPCTARRQERTQPVQTADQASPPQAINLRIAVAVSREEAKLSMSHQVTGSWRSGQARLCVLALGAAGATGIMTFGRLSPASAICGAALVALALTLCRHLTRLETRDAVTCSPQCNIGEPKQERKADGLRQLLRESLPMWRARLDETKLDAESAIGALAVEFSGLAQSLEACILTVDRVVGSADRATESSRFGMSIDSCSQILAMVVSRLESSLRDKALIIETLRSLEAEMNALCAMAKEVSSLASQGNLLALNAAIEAGHACAVGRGFCVVADAVRAMAARSDDIAQRIGRESEEASAIIHRVSTGVQASTNGDRSTLDDAQAGFEKVMTAFRTEITELVASLTQLRAGNATIRQSVMQSVIHLQFQDRHTQTLDQVSRCMDALNTHCELESDSTLDSLRLLIDSSMKLRKTPNAAVGQTGGAELF